MLRTALVPDEIQPEELEGMSDDFFEPVSSSSQTAGMDAPWLTNARTCFVTDLRVCAHSQAPPCLQHPCQLPG